MRVKQRFNDIDEHAAQMSGFDQRYVQMSPGSFQGVFSSLVLARDIGFDVEWLAQGVHQQACVPLGTVSIVTFLGVGGRAIFNGHRVGSHDSFFVSPGTELNVRTPPGATIAVVTVPLHIVDTEMPGVAENLRMRGAANATRLLDAAACAAVFEPTLRPLLHAIDAGADALESARVAEAIATDLLDATLRLVGTADDVVDVQACGSSAQRRALFLSALDIMDRLDADDLAVWKLCRVAGVSRRTLEYCFDEAVAMSPMQYLKARRLNAIRRELGGADTADVKIGDVAARHGVWHLGRLSKDYAQLFGELPSTTLRRSRSQADAVHRPAARSRA